MTDKYYEVLNPEQDNVVFICHSHIMNPTCSVELERLSDDTQYIYKAGRWEPSPQSSSTESTETSDSVTPKRKPCYRPKRKPSKARIRAQKIAMEQKKNKSLLTKPAHRLPLSKPPNASDMQPKVEDAAPTRHDSSDDTIIYTPPSSPVKKNKKKKVAKFIFRTVALKTHRDTEAVINLNKQRKHNFKCYLCGDTSTSARSLNTHFKINHKGLDCIVCDKEFNSPLSLKKHSYIHKLCNYKCTTIPV